MRISWMTGFALLFLVGMVISLTIEGLYFSSSESSTFYNLMNPDFGNISNPINLISGFFKLAWAFVQSIWAVLWWDYSFLDGSYAILRYAGWAGSIGIIVALVLAVRGSGGS